MDGHGSNPGTTVPEVVPTTVNAEQKAEPGPEPEAEPTQPAHSQAQPPPTNQTIWACSALPPTVPKHPEQKNLYEAAGMVKSPKRMRGEAGAMGNARRTGSGQFDADAICRHT